MDERQYIRNCRARRIIPKDAKKAKDNLADAWGEVWKARGLVRSAQLAIGMPSKWTGDLAKVHALLLQVSLKLEDINDEIREQEKGG